MIQIFLKEWFFEGLGQILSPIAFWKLLTNFEREYIRIMLCDFAPYFKLLG